MEKQVWNVMRLLLFKLVVSIMHIQGIDMKHIYGSIIVSCGLVWMEVIHPCDLLHS